MKSKEVRRRLFIVLSSLVLTSFSLRGAPLDNWHLRYSGPGTFSDVIYANGLFVAVRLYDPVMISLDGLAWTPQPSGIARFARGIAYGGGRFVVVAADGTNLTSGDGVNWTPTASGTPNELWDIVFAANQFVAVGPNEILRSADGLRWQPVSSAGGYQIKYGNGRFYVIGRFQSNVTSTDGINWTSVPSPARDNEYTVGFGSDTWVMVDIRQNILTSRDALNWSQRGTVDILRPAEIEYEYGIFVMVGGNSTILTSRNGLIWTERRRQANGSPLFAVAGGLHTFVAVGYQTILQSDQVVNIYARRGLSRELEISGPVGRACRIEVFDGPNSGWREIETVLLGSDPQPWIDPERTLTGSRFYRAVLLE